MKALGFPQLFPSDHGKVWFPLKSSADGEHTACKSHLAVSLLTLPFHHCLCRKQTLKQATEVEVAMILKAFREKINLQCSGM